MIIINTVIFISYYFLFLFSILGFGLLFCKFSNIFSNKINLGVIGLLGFCFLSFISYFTNLFFSHNFIHNIFIHSVGIISLFFFINKEKFYINENLKKLLLVSCLVISGLFISKNNEDFPYYHLSYVINLIDSNTIICKRLDLEQLEFKIFNDKGRLFRLDPNQKVCLNFAIRPYQ